MTGLLAKLVIAAFGLFLVGLGVAAWVRPRSFRAFLSAFAQTRRVHFLEMALRFLVGSAFIAGAASLPFASAFRMFGWLLLLTTAVLVVVPWRMHRDFANRVVPRALQHAFPVGAVSMAFGVVVLFALAGGGAP